MVDDRYAGHGSYDQQQEDYSGSEGDDGQGSSIEEEYDEDEEYGSEEYSEEGYCSQGKDSQGESIIKQTNTQETAFTIDDSDEEEDAPGVADDEHTLVEQADFHTDKPTMIKAEELVLEP